MKTFASGLVEFDVDGFLSQHDIVYLSPPEQGFEGLHIGNGDLGAMSWTPGNRLHFQINKCDTWDDKPPGMFRAWGEQEEEEATSLRHVGQLEINPGFPLFDWMYLEDFKARLDLAKATISWFAKGPLGEVRCSAFAASEPAVLAIHYRDKLAEGTTRRIRLARWGSRVFAHWYRWIRRHRYLGPIGTQSGAQDNELWIVQPTGSLEFAVACRIEGPCGASKRINSRCSEFEVEASKECEFYLYLTACTSEQTKNPLAKCRETLEHAQREGFEKISKAHHSHWRMFWEKSFVRLPDDYLENLWYANLYQTASSSQGRYPPHFINSLWSWNRDIRPWNHYYHWNQQQYTWFLHSSGHPELFLPYAQWAKEALPGAMHAAKTSRGKEGAFYSDVANRRGDQDESTDDWTGTENNLTPGTQIAAMLWQHYQFTADRDYLEQYAYPVMREVVRFYLDVLELGDDGLFHIPLSCPYEGTGTVRDTTTDLACIRQLFPAFVVAAEELGKDPELQRQAKDVVSKLADFVTMQIPEYAKLSGVGQAGEEVMSGGINLEDGEPYHVWLPDTPEKKRVLFSCAFQIAPIFPAALVSVDDKGSEFYNLMARTLRAFDMQDSLGIFGQLISAARMGFKDILAEELSQWINNYQWFPQGLFSYYKRKTQSGDAPHATRACERTATFHVKILDKKDGKVTKEETDIPQWPFAHCGLEASSIFHTTVNEMLLQSCGKRIHLFPATPDDWDCAFRLHARGGFVITSSRKSGQVRFVTVESSLGNTCTIASPWPKDEDWHVWDVSGDEVKKVAGDRGDIAFETVARNSYMIELKSEPVTEEDKLSLAGSVNLQSKHLREAILGKKGGCGRNKGYAP